MTSTYTTGTACTASGSLTMGKLLEGMNRVRQMMDAQRDFGRQLFDRIVESPMAVRTVPVRQHRKRRNQSATYHARIQKKWTKRWGTKEVPCAYQINGRQFGMDNLLVVPAGTLQRLHGQRDGA